MEDDSNFIETSSQKKKRVAIALITIGVILVIAIASALLVREFVLTTFIVDGPSMYPTLDGGGSALDDGEVLILNKLDTPNRDDIIVFNYDWGQEAGFEPHALVKRVIGVGGDKIKFENNELYVNGIKLTEDYINGEMYTPDAEYTVPSGCYFVLGDNRNNSNDSRMIGSVPKDKVLGVCVLVVGTDKSLRIPD